MCSEPPADETPEDIAQRELFERVAAEHLWRWTGRALGVCTVKFRPCRRECYEGRDPFHGRGPVTPMNSWYPVLIQGDWMNVSCGRCGTICSCDSVDSIELPGPVSSVSEVLIDGVALLPGDYRVDNGKYLLRLDGESWPKCQSMGLATTEENTWQITYDRGVPVPEGGQVATGLLAAELLKASCKDRTCQLPQRLQSVTRQGVSMTILDSFADLKDGATGIWYVDTWVASMLKSPSGGRVYSVDVGSRGRTEVLPNLAGIPIRRY